MHIDFRNYKPRVPRCSHWNWRFARNKHHSELNLAPLEQLDGDVCVSLPAGCRSSAGVHWKVQSAWGPTGFPCRHLRWVKGPAAGWWAGRVPDTGGTSRCCEHNGRRRTLWTELGDRRKTGRILLSRAPLNALTSHSDQMAVQLLLRSLPNTLKLNGVSGLWGESHICSTEKVQTWRSVTSVTVGC